MLAHVVLHSMQACTISLLSIGLYSTICSDHQPERYANRLLPLLYLTRHFVHIAWLFLSTLKYVVHRNTLVNMSHCIGRRLSSLTVTLSKFHKLHRLSFTVRSTCKFPAALAQCYERSSVILDHSAFEPRSGIIIPLLQSTGTHPRTPYFPNPRGFPSPRAFVGNT